MIKNHQRFLVETDNHQYKQCELRYVEFNSGIQLKEHMVENYQRFLIETDGQPPIQTM